MEEGPRAAGLPKAARMPEHPRLRPPRQPLQPPPQHLQQHLRLQGPPDVVERLSLYLVAREEALQVMDTWALPGVAARVCGAGGPVAPPPLLMVKYSAMAQPAYAAMYWSGAGSAADATTTVVYSIAPLARSTSTMPATVDSFEPIATKKHFTP